MNVFKLLDADEKIIAIVGMAKNAGKTVTLNHFIEEAEEDKRVLGLTSIGRDGERIDLVTQTQKPMIYVSQGTFFATAEMLFETAEVKCEVIEVTPYQTAMGRMIIGRTLSDGYLQLAGPNTNKTIRAVSERMLELGAESILVDGALDRNTSASPAISDACVLSTGAVVSREMTKTIQETVHKASLMRLPKTQLPDQDWMKPLNKVHVVNQKGQVRVLEDIKTALGAGKKIAEAITEETTHVVFPGALVNRTLKEIVESVAEIHQIELIVKDATKIFIDYRDWQLYMRQGIKITVLDPINLKMITVNPYSPSGYYYDRNAFIQGLKRALKDIQIVDVMAIEEAL